MARLPTLTRDQLDADGQASWDRVMIGGRNAGGPNACVMHHPALAEGLTGLGSVLRWNGVLPGADRELAILTAGREVEAPYEWVGHLKLGLEAGVRPEAIEVVRNHQPTDSLEPREALIVDVVRSLYREHAIPNDLYARAEGELSRQELVELVVLAGYYG